MRETLEFQVVTPLYSRGARPRERDEIRIWVNGGELRAGSLGRLGSMARAGLAAGWDYLDRFFEACEGKEEVL